MCGRWDLVQTIEGGGSSCLPILVVTIEEEATLAVYCELCLGG